jgi:hypothetical protein
LLGRTDGLNGQFLIAHCIELHAIEPAFQLGSADIVPACDRDEGGPNAGVSGVEKSSDSAPVCSPFLLKISNAASIASCPTMRERPPV